MTTHRVGIIPGGINGLVRSMNLHPKNARGCGSKIVRTWGYEPLRLRQAELPHSGSRTLRESNVLEFSDQNRLRDVLVTGLGLVTPLGCSSNETWQTLLAGGRSGKSLTPNEVDHFPELCGIEGLKIHGAPVDHEILADRLAALESLSLVPAGVASVWQSEPMVAMSLVALHEAAENARLLFGSLTPERTAVVFGSSKGGLRSTEEMSRSLDTVRQKKRSELNPCNSVDSGSQNTRNATHPQRIRSTATNPALWRHGVLPDSASNALTLLTGARAVGSCPVAACATGLIAFLQGAMLIHSGECDVCIVGSADAAIRSSILASFHRLRVTSRNSNPASACRPFDESRDGFLIGEGAAVGILESRAHAEARGAIPIAKIVAGGWLNDSTGITQIDESGDVVHELLKRTMTSMNRTPDFINLHGTGTVSNDLAEARGVHATFGTGGPVCFGVKGAMGHLLGAAGSVETALTLMALQRKQVPGTTNLRAIDPRFQINLQSSAMEMISAMSAAKLSLGFGGHMACGYFERD